MTRKDYPLLTLAIQRAAYTARNESEDVLRGVHWAARAIADALAQDNPCFDRARFLKDAGVLSS